MIDLNKSRDFFDPSKIKMPVHIIGCGAIGSHLAETLARLGVTDIHLWDTDTVASHNIANQMFVFNQIGMLKIEAVNDMIQAINPGCKVTMHNAFVTTDTYLKGYVCMCVDSIAARKEIATATRCMPNVLAVFDFRMGLLSGQFYCADTPRRRGLLLKTMNFTDEEADAMTPRSACNFELSVVYTIKTIIGVGVNEMVRHWLGKPTHLTTIINLEDVPTITQM